MQWIKVFGGFILAVALGQVVELAKNTEKKDLFAMLVNIGYILVFGFVGLAMLLSIKE